MRLHKCAYTLASKPFVDFLYINTANFNIIQYICNQIVYLRIIAIYYPSHKSKNDETNRNNS